MQEVNTEEHEYIIAIEEHASDWEEAIRICGQALIAHECIGAHFMEACVEREKSFPTGLPSAVPVAIPHASSHEVHKTSVCVLRLKQPVVFHRMDESEETVETRLIFNLAIKGSGSHLEFLQKLIAFVMDEDKVQKCMELKTEDIPSYLKMAIV